MKGTLEKRAAEMRERPTQSEAALCRALQMFDQKWAIEPQAVALDRYILDFYIPDIQLAIEVDGPQHREPDHWRSDLLRSQRLEEHGIRVLRFTNQAIVSRLDAVMAEIAYEAIWREREIACGGSDPEWEQLGLADPTTELTPRRLRRGKEGRAKRAKDARPAGLLRIQVRMRLGRKV